ncbi:hypothetical protein MKX01_021315 [Papaver californicum]|nr:hypothetical protein MKX01_021315 [Papaver californicum]
MAGFQIQDGFPADRLFNQGYSYTYNDMIFLPHYIDFPTDAVNLSTKLTKNIGLSIPCVASPMDTVTESSMVVAMADLGGIGIVHYTNQPFEQAALIRFAKSRHIPFIYDPIFKGPSDSIDFIDDFSSSPCVFVTESRNSKSKMLGVVGKSDWEKLTDKETPLSDFMFKSPVSAPSSYTFEQVGSVLASQKLDYLPLVNESGGEVVDLFTKGDVDRIQGFPKLGLPSLGKDGNFMVEAAIGTMEQDKERLEHLVKAGADVMVVDSLQGNSIYQIEMTKFVKRTYPDLDVIAGNIVTAYQVQNLIQSGADALSLEGRYGFWVNLHNTRGLCSWERTVHGNGILEAMTKGSDSQYLGDKSKLKIAQGVVGDVADKGSLLKLIPYTMQAVKQGFQDLGSSSITSAHDLLRSSVLRLEVYTGAAQLEGGVHDLVFYEKKSF